MNLTRRYGPWVLLALAVMLAPMPATATITFDGTSIPNVTTFQQTTNSPCVIGDMSCKEPPNFGYTAEPGTPDNVSAGVYDLSSPVYQASGLSTGVVGNASGLDFIPLSFTIGIDENLATKFAPEYLMFFKTWICSGVGSGTCTNLDGANSYQTITPIPNNNNGNGFSDALLLGFSLTSGTNYMFEVRVSNDTDGMEEFFIIPSGTPPTATPEPGSILMLGTTLIGIGAITRRRLNRKSVQ